MEGDAVVHRGRSGGSVLDVLERRVVVKGMTHHDMVRRSVRVPRGRAHHVTAIFVVVVVHALLAHEIFGALVLVCAAILKSSQPCLIETGTRKPDKGEKLDWGVLHIGSGQWSR